MINYGKFKILDNYITACDYEFVLKQIEKSINCKRKLLISPIASQTLVLAIHNKSLLRALHSFTYLVPDSQWVKRSINWIYGTHLNKRVYGPNLMIQSCALAERKKWGIYLYGTNITTLKKLKGKLLMLYPKLSIIKSVPSKYRDLTKNEIFDLMNDIDISGAHIVYIGIGSPRQEMLTKHIATYNTNFNKIIIPVGAAFDYISGTKKQAPGWIGDLGFEWLFRLILEPSRLFQRYLVNGSLFIIMIATTCLRINLKKCQNQ